MVAIVATSSILGTGGLILLNDTPPIPSDETFILYERGPFHNDYYNSTTGNHTAYFSSGYVNYQTAEDVGKGLWSTPINTTFILDGVTDELVMNQSLYTIVVAANRSWYRIYPDRNNETAWIDLYMPDIQVPEPPPAGFSALTPGGEGDPVDFFGAKDPTLTDNQIEWEYDDFSISIDNGASSSYFIYTLNNANAAPYLNMTIFTNNLTLNENGTIDEFPAVHLTNRVWGSNDTYCDFNYTYDSINNWLNISIPPDELAKLTYPIYIDPTIEIEGDPTDGRLSHSSPAWDTIREAAVCDTARLEEVRAQDMCRTDRWGVTYNWDRSFFEFNTSEILDDATIVEVVLQIHGYSRNACGAIIIKGDWGDVLNESDWQGFDRTRDYTGNLSWLVNVNNTMTLNSEAREDINKTGMTQYCIQEYYYDYGDNQPGTKFFYSCGGYYANASILWQRPLLTVTYSVEPTLDLFEVVPEGNYEWDLDNNDAIFNWSITNPDPGERLDIYITFCDNKTGLVAREPGFADYDYRYNGTTNVTDNTILWNFSVADWKDYGDSMHMKAKVWDGYFWSNNLTADLDDGIDGTNPIITDNQTGYDPWVETRTSKTFDVNFSDATSGLADIECSDSEEGTYYSIAAVENASSYDTDWYLPTGVWDDLEQGNNTIHVRTRDEADSVWVYDNTTFWIYKESLPPTVEITAIPYLGSYPQSISGNSSDAGSGVYNTTITIYDATDDDYWTGVAWGAEVDLTTTPDAYDGIWRNWSYDTSGIAWEYGDIYWINATSTDNVSWPSTQAQETFKIPNILFSSEYPDDTDTDVMTMVKDLHCNVTGHVSWNITLRDEDYALVESSIASDTLDGRKWLNLSTNPFNTRYNKDYYLNITATNGSITLYQNTSFSTCEGVGFILFDNITETVSTTPRFYQVYVHNKFKLFATAWDDGLHSYEIETDNTLDRIDQDRTLIGGEYSYYSINGNDTYVVVGCRDSAGIHIYDNTLTLNLRYSNLSGFSVYSIDMNETIIACAVGTDGFYILSTDGSTTTILDHTTLVDSANCTGIGIDETNNRIYVTTSDNGTAAYSYNPSTHAVALIDGWNTETNCESNKIIIDSDEEIIIPTESGLMTFTCDGATLTREIVNTTYNNYDNGVLVEDKYIIGTHDETAEISSAIYPNNLFVVKKTDNISDSNRGYTNGVDVDEDDVYIVIANEEYLQLYGFDLSPVAPPVIDLIYAGNPSNDIASDTKDGSIRYLNHSYHNETYINITADISVPEERYIGRYQRTSDDSYMIPTGIYNDSDRDAGGYQHESNHTFVASQYECEFTGYYHQVSAYVTTGGPGALSPAWIAYAIYDDNNGEPGDLLGYTERGWPGSDTFNETERDMNGISYYPTCTNVWFTSNISYDANGASINNLTLTEGQNYWLVIATNDSLGYVGYGYTYGADIYWLAANKIGDTSYMATAQYNLEVDMNYSNVSSLSWSTCNDAYYGCIYAIANDSANDLASVNTESATVQFYNETSWENHIMVNYVDNNWTVNITGLTNSTPWHKFNISVTDESQNNLVWENFRFKQNSETEYVQFKTGVVADYDDNNHTTDLYSPDYVLYLQNATYATAAFYGDDENKESVLRHEQGVDGTFDDTGYWMNIYPDDTFQTRYCLKFAGGWWDENISIESDIELNNMLIHWWTQGGDEPDWDGQRIHFGRMTTLYNFGWLEETGDPDWNYVELQTNASTRDKIILNVPPSTVSGSDPTGVDNTCRLISQHVNISQGITDSTFDSSSIYNFFTGVDANDSVAWGQAGAMIFSNYSYPGYIIFNVPQDIFDGTDNTTDSDSDTIPDHWEMNGTFTHPFEEDTDKDGYLDAVDGSPNVWWAYTDRTPQINVTSGSPNATSDEQTADFSVKIWDEDNDFLTAEWWWKNETNVWHKFATNSSIDVTGILTQTEITQSDSNFTTDAHLYTWSINVTDGVSWKNQSYSFRAEVDEVIQNDGIDYFVWLQDSSAYHVAQEIVGFNSNSEYIAIWDRSSWDTNDWLWKKYYGDAHGTNFTVAKYDVIMVSLEDSGTQTIYINVDFADDYSGDVNMTLANNASDGLGWNFNATVTYDFSSNLNSTNATVGLSWDWDAGWAEAVGVWNDTTEGSPKWDWWFAGWPYNIFNTNIGPWCVLQWKIADTVRYFDTSDF